MLMSKTWSEYINQILTNTDNGRVRNVEPIDDIDKINVIPLDSTEALILWDRYFPEAAKYALKYERTYGEPFETSLFDENLIDSNARKRALMSMNTKEIPILVYWNSCAAIKTTWGMLIKYWDNFFYYPEDAIIYVNQQQIYFYNEMILKKLNDLQSKRIFNESVFDCLQSLKDINVKKLYQIDCLFEEVPNNLHNVLFYLLFKFSEAFKVIDDDEIRKEYMKYCFNTIGANTQKIVLASKPYNKKSLQQLINDLKDEKTSNKSYESNFYEILNKIANKQL